jgi:hypothetical protein
VSSAWLKKPGNRASVEISKVRKDDAPSIERIPKGFGRKAQGCEERATLGNRAAIVLNPKGVAPVRLVSTPLGLASFGISTQGSSFLATLGWETQSRWD